MRRFKALAIISLLFVNVSVAADIGRQIETGNNKPNLNDGGYFELGAGIAYTERSRIISLDDDKNNGADFKGVLGGEYRYKNFFLEASVVSRDGINVGYNFFTGSNWTVDILLSAERFVIGDDDDSENLTEEERNDELLDRSKKAGVGFRATGYSDEYILQLRLLDDIYNDGVLGSVRLGRGWQVKNWNVYSIFSIDYNSAELNQEDYGVTAAEATPLFTEYYSDSSVSYGAEIGVSYPITENWVFRSSANVTKIPSELENSPLVDKDIGFSLRTIISYVF